MVRRAAAGLLAAAVFAGSAFQAYAEVPASLLAARRAKSDPALSLLTYQHIDQLFETKPVKAGGRVWTLGKSQRSLDSFTYQFEGKSYRWSEFFERTKANAGIVLKNGKIVGEVYRNGSGPQTRFIVYSMSKSVISVLTGLAIKDGSIGIDDPVTKYLPELTGAAYDGVTIRHLLRMRSGVAWTEAYAPGTELDRIRDGSTNQNTMYYEDYALKARRAVEPGSTFNYSTLETGVLGMALERAVKRPLPEFMSERLWKPAGMEYDGYWMAQGPEGKLRPWFGAGFNTSLRDFARLGQIMADGGKAAGRQIVPADWVKLTTDNADKGPYLYSWWPVSGTESFAALGTYGQALMVDPSTDTVMVLFSYWPPNAPDERASNEQEAVFKQLVEALRDVK